MVRDLLIKRNYEMVRRWSMVEDGFEFLKNGSWDTNQGT